MAEAKTSLNDMAVRHGINVKSMLYEEIVLFHFTVIFVYGSFQIGLKTNHENYAMHHRNVGLFRKHFAVPGNRMLRLYVQKSMHRKRVICSAKNLEKINFFEYRFRTNSLRIQQSINPVLRAVNVA